MCAVGSGVLVDSSGGCRPILTSLQSVHCVFMFSEGALYLQSIFSKQLKAVESNWKKDIFQEQVKMIS